jgi:hypothetical protein
MSVNQQARSFPGRDFYRPGGGINLGLFLIWTLLAISAAALLALLLCWLYISGHYYLIFVPLVAALAVGALVRLAVIKGHCRNRLMGGLAGLCAATVLYFGYFYCGMVYHWGPRVVARPGLLPIYISARMKADVVHDVGRPWESATRDTGMNWFMFSMETGIVFIFVVFSGVQRSRRPYCEACGRWMTRRVTPFSPNAAAGVMDALRTGSSHALAELCATPAYSTVPNLSVGIDLCPTFEEGGSRGCPAYISVKQVAQAAALGNVDPIDQAKGKLLLRTLLATSGEIAALAPRFKLLETVTGSLPAAAATDATAAQADLPEKIQAVEPEFAGRALTSGMLWIGTILTLIPLLLLIGGLGLAVWSQDLSHTAVTPVEKLSVLAMMVAAGLCMVVGPIMGMRNPTYFANKVLEKRLRQKLALHPKRVVNPHDPQALFVEIVPKANWGQLMLDTASDVGLLLLDEPKGELLFEGDRQRFRIPADAITYCGLEEFVHQQGLGKNRLYYVVLRIERPKQFWEAPIRVRSGSAFGSRTRKKEMTSLFNRVQQMRGVGQAATK